MERYKTLLFVDSDDTCRAAMIRILMQKKELLVPLRIESRGLVVLFPEPLDAKANAVLEEYGYGEFLSHQAQQLTQEDIGDDVLLLTMEDKQKIRIWEEFENARNVHTLAEFISYSGDILPLYGEPIESYQEWVQKMDLLLDELAARLNEKNYPFVLKPKTEVPARPEEQHEEKEAQEDDREEN